MPPDFAAANLASLAANVQYGQQPPQQQQPLDYMRRPQNFMVRFAKSPSFFLAPLEVLVSLG
jgi:hypothetical protein